MASVGVERLARPRMRDARTLRVCTAVFAILISVGLATLAGRPAAERSPIEVYNFADAPVEAVRPAFAGKATRTAPVATLRPALQPGQRNLPTTRGRTRQADLGIWFETRRH